MPSREPVYGLSVGSSPALRAGEVVPARRRRGRRLSDTRNHGGGSLLNLSNGEPQNNNPVGPQPLIPGMVVRDLSGFIVDWSIHLDS